MDLLSERTYTTSTDTELSNQDREEDTKIFAAYYKCNHVICNRTLKKKPKKICQARLNDNDFRMNREIPLTTSNNNINLIIKQNHEQDLRSTRNKLVIKTQSVLSLETKINDSNQASHSRSLSKTEAKSKLTFVKRSNKYNTFQNIAQNKAGPENADKTTYCRPFTDSYSQEFISKTIERNARLQGLVRRLVLARQREKQNVSWYNYLNELKNKHRYNEFSIIPTYMPDNPNIELINDYYTTKFTRKQSYPCQNLLHDFYEASDDTDLENHKCSHVQVPFNYRPYAYKTNRYCFPTSAQERLTVTNRQKPKYKFPSPSHNRSSSTYGGTPIFVDREGQCTNKSMFKITQSNKILDLNKPAIIKSLSIQTDLNAVKDKIMNEYGTEETFSNKYNRINNNVNRLKQKIMRTQSNVKSCSLSSIENKLDLLIHSISTLIVEIKAQRALKNTVATAVQLSNVSSLINLTNSDTYNLRRNEQIVCEQVQERQRSTSKLHEENRNDMIDKILYEEMHKSNKVKKDIEDILNKPGYDHPSLHITFDIPTKERATEITDSLSKAGHSHVVVEEIDNQDKSITIAVNTDPLGLLALFRVSTEAMKQVLSYIPHIDYLSYLSRLPIPQLSRNEMTHYVCNICGAAFGRPSQLSDHIHTHNLGNSRDCSVCRHVLDMQYHKTGLFLCRYCGQRFTRAYCCELHEQECGRKLGRPPEVTSSLLHLR